MAAQNLLSNCPGLEGIQVAAYDGDTLQEDRRKCVCHFARLNYQEVLGQVRENASIIFTNFVGLSFPIEILSLTTSTGHDPLFDPSS